jgi:hypothetical protein
MFLAAIEAPRSKLWEMRSFMLFTLDELETVTKALTANLPGSEDIRR